MFVCQDYVAAQNLYHKLVFDKEFILSNNQQSNQGSALCSALFLLLVSHRFTDQQFTAVKKNQIKGCEEENILQFDILQKGLYKCVLRKGFFQHIC